MKATRVSEEAANSIAREMDEKIFAPLRAEFKLLYTQDDAEEEEYAGSNASSLDPRQVGEPMQSREGTREDTMSYPTSPAPAPPTSITPPTNTPPQPNIGIETVRLAGENNLPTEVRETTALTPPTPPKVSDPYREPI